MPFFFQTNPIWVILKCVPQQRSRLARRNDEFAGEQSRGNVFPSSERVRILQPLLPHPQEGWWSKTHSWSQTSELRLYKQIVSQICPVYWFFSLDLKDAYFHVQIAPHHRRFLIFAFEGVAYQYTVLPFGLSFAPHTFTKCMNVALSPLRQMGIRILNYLEDWLILAQSEDELLSHRYLTQCSSATQSA